MPGYHVGRKFVKIIQVQDDADPAGNGQEMDDEVRGAADRGVDDDGIFKSFPSQDVGGPHVFPDHFHDPAPRHLCKHLAARICCRDGGIVRKGQPQRRNHAGHGGSCFHHSAMSAAPGHAGFGDAELFLRHRAGTHGVMEAPHVAGTDVVAKEFPGEHRSAGHNDGRDVDAKAPITREGVVLSQPHSSTTPSTGLARMDSSASMLARLR
jgi:hypothetical protein